MPLIAAVVISAGPTASAGSTDVTVSRIMPRSGLVGGGIAVTITGTGFDTTPGATTVDFGAVPATQVSCHSTTTCVAFSPPGTEAAVLLTATVGSATSAPVPAATFTYLSGPPRIEGLTPACGPEAGGTTVIISGTGFSLDATRVSFGTSLLATGTSTVASNTTILVPRAPAHPPGHVDVTTTTAQGTSNGSVFTYPCPSLAGSGSAAIAANRPGPGDPGSGTGAPPVKPAPPPPPVPPSPPAPAPAPAPAPPAPAPAPGPAPAPAPAPALAPAAAPAPASPVIGVAQQDHPGAVPDYAMVRRPVPGAAPASLLLTAAGLGTVVAGGLAVHGRRRREVCLAVDAHADPLASRGWRTGS
ncbi:MAG: IPT/TIG domain-containing protein [Actinomycetota bacterium]|nr:IPT/TIG domain-containing protein [Actinomycetota bacterium]